MIVRSVQVLKRCDCTSMVTDFQRTYQKEVTSESLRTFRKRRELRKLLEARAEQSVFPNALAWAVGTGELRVLFLP
jgi:hypothetical protein